jgi:hypothetical protein
MTRGTTTKAAPSTAADKAPVDTPSDALREAGQRLLGLLVQRAAQAATERVEDLADRLGDIGQDGGPGLSALLSGGGSLLKGESPAKSAVAGGLASLKEKVKGLFGGGGGGGKKIKVTNIVEQLDVGLPVRVTYNLWTQFEDFPSYMKKVKSVEQADDEKVNWKAQVFWSNRTWEATILEQVPDSHIVWRSKGAKGHVNGAVSFTGLGPNLTRVLLVLEYYPQGLFERTGNIWRAQGRRARLEFKHFRRNAMTQAILHQEEIEGWRGEIRDSEVVRTHEEALREEEERAAGPDESAGEAQGKDDDVEKYEGDDDREDDDLDASYDDAEDVTDEDETERDTEDEADEEADDTEDITDEDAAYEDDYPEDDEYDEPDAERTASAGAGARRRR